MHELTMRETTKSKLGFGKSAVRHMRPVYVDAVPESGTAGL